MYFGSNTLGIFLNEEYEPEVTEVFLNNIYEGDVVVDVGANIGFFTLLAARKVGVNGKVFAFEPELSNYNILLKNIEINGYTNIVPIQKAVSNENKVTKLFIREDPSMNSLLDGFTGNSPVGEVSVNSITLNSFFKDNPLKMRIKLIKMDIEGAEMMALIGMEDLIRENEDLILITEFNPWFIKNSGFEPVEYLKKLKEYGFVYQVISENGSQNLKNSNLSEIDSYVNLICYKQK